MSTTLSVVLVHRNEYERGQLRTAFEALPHVQISGERSDLRAGMALAQQVRPAILVLELANPIEDTLNSASQYKLDHPDCAVFFASEVFDPETLLRALRSGASEVLRRPLDRSALSKAVERVAAVTARRSGTSSQRMVLTVFSNKGGSGISTIATNLALSLKRQTHREVALVDFDYQSGDVAFLLGITPKRSLGDVLSAPRIDSASVQDALTKHESDVYVLAQPEHLDRVDGVTANQVGSVLEILSSTFDIVVVDAPHLFNDVALEIFDRSSSILMVAEPNIPSVRAARRSLEIFSKLNFLVVPDRVRLIMNRRSEQNAISTEQVEETLGIRVFGSIANDYAAVSQALNTGKPLCGEHTDSRAGRDITALARQLAPGESTNGTAETVPAVRRPGRLRLFGKG
jgi:pilus assembly protein CpaE